MNKKVNFIFAFALASLFASSSLMGGSVFAQSNGNDDDDGTDLNNYEDFVNCLSQSEGEKGYASEDEIRDCFRPIYDPESATDSSVNDSNDSNDNLASNTNNN